MKRDRYWHLRRAAQWFGYDLVRSDFYSPVPQRWALELWRHPADMPGVDLRLDAAADFLRTLAPLIAEYAPPAAAPGTKHGYHHSNGMYPQVDGEVLYGMLRHLQPERIVEIGAGWSTRVIADAVDANGGVRDHRIFDPFPAGHLRSLGANVEPLSAEKIPLNTFADLASGDVLFIDTTHTVKPGNDVVRLILEVLPRLAAGVVVHIHDIFLPFTYPEFMFDHGAYWQEQYLVQAFLAFNPVFEVLIANYAMTRLRPAAIDAAGMAGHVPGSALWLRRI